MKIEEVAKLTPEERFLYWIVERYRVYERRNKDEPKPWTDDEVLQSYFFTMPYRELDKTTEWFRANIRDPLSGLQSVAMATIIFRWFNWIPTGKILLGPNDSRENLLLHWNTRRACEVLSKVRDSGDQVFTGAFNISNSGSTKPKINRVCEDYIEPVWQVREQLLKDLEACDTLRAAHIRLMQCPGLRGSGFMAYEVVCDLRYTYLLCDATDICTWSNPGPGAKRGLNRMLGRPLEAVVKQVEWMEKSAELLDYVNENLPTDMPRFEMREVEHSLCEFDKMERARLGDGHLKRRYNGV